MIMHILSYSLTHCIYFLFSAFLISTFTFLFSTLYSLLSSCNLVVILFRYSLFLSLTSFLKSASIFLCFSLTWISSPHTPLAPVCKLLFKCPYLSCIPPLYNILIQFCTLVVSDCLIHSL
jgi:hypothetical protein